MGEGRCELTQAEMDARFWRQTKICWGIGLLGACVGLSIYFVNLQILNVNPFYGILLGEGNGVFGLILFGYSVAFLGVFSGARVLQRRFLMAMLKSKTMHPLNGLWFWKRWLLLSDELIGARL